MKRKDAVCQELERLTLALQRETLTDSAGFDAETIGFNLGLARNSVSKELNQLCTERLVIKIKSRPVLFLHRAVAEKLLNTTFNGDGPLEVKTLAELLPADDRQNTVNADPFHALIGYDRSLKLAVDIW
ncbi:hypothetical protein [Budvicia aquatica]|uniref:Transcriptional antiterminator n=1 Tax=Budvicia aquatica TaxID=82979 RepID=A0A2C6DKA3_9GAMM|nr:hypothetical protein [Budvicia aquatica]PHI28762.1 hypothetical protein CRN84_05245 [Budvicia aquatica]VFS46814.1 Transcriptional antiterminator [Budvicia aquatica]